MGELRAPSSGVAVRMYSRTAGDWFLLAFKTDRAGTPFYLLIDCGVTQSTTNPGDALADLAAEIRAATDGEIHLLVATRERPDAVSGLTRADALAQHLTIHDIWLPWTENPGDRLAMRLRADLERDRKVLCQALGRSGKPQAAQLARLLGCSDDPSVAPTQPTSDGTAVRSNGSIQPVPRAFRGLKTRAGTARSYLRSGDGPLELAAPNGLRVPGARVYVLGPGDEAVRAAISPTAIRGASSGGVAALNERTALMLALRDPGDLTEDEAELRELCFPFNCEVRMPRRDAERDPFFREHYGFGQHPESDWRRIDNDWQGLSVGIAGQIAQHITNTSVALAIELVNSRKVLLLAGGEQVGAWLDGDQVDWSVTDHQSGAVRKVRTNALLQRTTLYMVNDHGVGSTTAPGTDPRRLVAALPPDRELVALVPVDRAEQRNKSRTMMPSDPLLRRLDERASWRILRSGETFPRSGPAGVSGVEWRSFRARFKETHRYRQYTVTD